MLLLILKKYSLIDSSFVITPFSSLKIIEFHTSQNIAPNHSQSTLIEQNRKVPPAGLLSNLLIGIKFLDQLLGNKRMFINFRNIQLNHKIFISGDIISSW